MADKLPRGFSLPKRLEGKTGPSDPKARPLSKKDGKRPADSQDPRKKGHDTLADSTTAKKLKTGNTPPPVQTPKKPVGESVSVHVSNLFGPIAAPYISENLIHKWQSQPSEDQDLAAIRASAQLLTQSIGRAQRNQEWKLAVSKLKQEKKKLEEMVVETDNKWKKDFDAAQAEIRILKDELKDADERDTILCKSIDALKAEKEDLLIKLDTLEIDKSEWEKEKDSIEKSSFMSGFHCYLLNFLAHDPNYDWTKFGPGCVEDIAAFKADRADDIKARRVELGFEKEEGGAPLIIEVPSTDQAQASPPAVLEKDVSAISTVPLQSMPPGGTS